MKVHPSNQTLILASDRRAASRSSSALDQAISAASNGGSLKRVTIVAAQPDASVLYLRAEYADTTADVGSRAAAGRASAAGASKTPVATAPNSVSPSRGVAVSRTALLPAYSNGRDEYGNIRGNVSEVSLSSYLKPAEQYAQTQRLLGTTPHPSYIDVLA